MKFFIFLNPLRMSLTHPSLILWQFLLRSTFLRHLILSGTPLFFMNLFRLPPSLLYVMGANFRFWQECLHGLFKSHKSLLLIPWRCSARIRFWPCAFLSFHQRSPYASTFFCQLLSLCWQLCHLLLLLGPCCCWGHSRSADSTKALIWVLVSSSQSEQMWGLLLGEFPSSQPPVPPLLFTLILRFNLTPTFHGVTFDQTLFFFLNVCFRLRSGFSLFYRSYVVSRLSHGADPRSSCFFLHSFFSVSSHLCLTRWFLFCVHSPFMLSPISPRETFFVFPSFTPWNPSSFSVELTLPTQCFRSEPLFLAKVSLCCFGVFLPLP